MPSLLLRLAAHPMWPLWLIHAIGASLGWIAWLSSPTYHRRFTRNAAQAGLTAPQRRRAVAEAGKMVAELPRLWLRPRDQAIHDPVQWEGLDILERCVAQPRGLILLTPHLGSFEVSAQAYVEHFGPEKPLSVLYRPARQPWLARIQETARDRLHLRSAPASLAGVRKLMRALKQGECVGVLPDQVPPQGQGVWAPFFGQPAYTMTLAARLARQTNAALLYLVTERLGAGRGYVVRVIEPPEPLSESTASDEDDAATINRSMEAIIRRWPEQYLWGYHRYKQPRATVEAA